MHPAGQDFSTLCASDAPPQQVGKSNELRTKAVAFKIWFDRNYLPYTRRMSGEKRRKFFPPALQK
jgi:hypothetical protein